MTRITAMEAAQREGPISVASCRASRPASRGRADFTGECRHNLQVRFELHTATGRADYVLLGPHGPICVLEAKREDADPYDAKEQGRGYAENMRAPFVLLSNGREHWFWNYERATERDAYRIERVPSREDLVRLRLKNLKPPRPLSTEVLTPGYLK